MRDNQGTTAASLRQLTTTLARDAIFVRKELSKSSLSGRFDTRILSDVKSSYYITTLVQSHIRTNPLSNLNTHGVCAGNLCRRLYVWTPKRSCKVQDLLLQVEISTVAYTCIISYTCIVTPIIVMSFSYNYLITTTFITSAVKRVRSCVIYFLHESTGSYQ